MAKCSQKLFQALMISARSAKTQVLTSFFMDLFKPENTLKLMAFLLIIFVD